METICDIYCRVSTTEQAEHGYSIADQEQKLRLYAEAQGWRINNVLLDGGFSGGSLNRPGIQSVIADAKSHKINKVIVYKIDRLSRSQKDTLCLIEDVFIKNGVDFVSMTESLDTSTPFGMAMVGILSVFAQLERETIRERMSNGRNARIKSGKYRGSGHLPVGYTYSDGELHLNEYEAMIVRNLFEEYANGATANSLAVWLNTEVRFRQRTWSSSKVKRLLTQPLYIGLQRWHGEEIAIENCPTVVEPELFYSVQKEIAKRSSAVVKPQSHHKHTTLLGGLLWCGCCGQRFTAESDHDARGNRIHRYYCYGRILKNHHREAEPCSNRSWRADELNAIVIEEIRKLSADRSLLESSAHTSNINDYLAMSRAINSRIDEIDSQINKLVDLYSLGRIELSVIAEKSEKLQSEKDALVEKLAELKKPSGALNKAEAETAFNSFNELVDAVGSDYMELYGIVHQLVHSVTLEGDTVRIVWNFEAQTENL